MSTTYRYHHVGIPTATPIEGMTRLDHLRIACTDHESNPFGIQWMCYDQHCAVPPLVREVAHVAFEVDDLAEALIGKKVIIPPNSPKVPILAMFPVLAWMFFNWVSIALSTTLMGASLPRPGASKHQPPAAAHHRAGCCVIRSSLTRPRLSANEPARLVVYTTDSLRIPEGADS